MCFISVATTVLLITRDSNEGTLLYRAKGNPAPHVSWIGPDEEVKNAWCRNMAVTNLIAPISLYLLVVFLTHSFGPGIELSWRTTTDANGPKI